MKLQATINEIDDWAKKWRIKIKQSKSTHITSTLRMRNQPVQQYKWAVLIYPRKMK
jgi:hypothetical protein